MSEQKGIIRNHQTGNPENPKFNQCWRPALLHNESPQASSDQKHREQPQQGSRVRTANGAASRVAGREEKINLI